MPGTDVEPRPGGFLVPVPGLPQRKRESEALPARWARAARRNRAVTVPAAVPVVTWTAAEIMRANGLGLEVGFAGVTASVAVWLFAPHKWTGKDGGARAPEVWYARSTAVTFSGWLTAASLLGPVSASGAPLAGSLAVLSGTWGYFWWRHYRVRGRKDREKFLAGCRAFWDGHAPAWGVSGSNVIDAEETPAQARIRVQLIGGRQSLQTLKGSVHLIESAVPVGAGMVRIEGVDGNASQADVFITRENPLKDPVEWDSPFAPRSVHEDRVIARSETGEWARAPQRVSTFINGMTRSGKGNHLLVRVVQLLSCPDARTVYIDLKQRSARPLIRSQAVDWVITDRGEARAYLAMLCAEIAARARDWHDGEEQALATPSSPALFTLTDEANPLTSATAGDAECARLLAIGASQGSGLEVYYDVATQYGSLDESVRTEQIRGNLGLRVCYRTVAPEHGQFALGDAWKYDTSKLEEKGEFLYKLGPKSRPAKVRAPHMPFSLLEEIAPGIAREVRKPRVMLWCGNEPSAMPGLTWQEWWDRRWLRINPAFREDSPQYDAALEEFGDPEEAPAAPGYDSPSPVLSRPRMAPAPPLPASGDEDGAEVAARIAAETSGPDLAVTPAASARADEIYQQNLNRFFELLSSAPPEGVRTTELIGQSGVSNGQAYKILDLLAPRGVVSRPGRGLCAPVPGHDPAAEYAAVRAGQDALGRAAEKRRRLRSVS